MRGINFGRFAFAFAAMLLLFAGMPFASVNPKVQLQGYELSEVPAIPGHIVNLTLHFKSVESDNCAERLSVQLAVAYPLSLQGPDTQYVDGLCFRDPDSKGTFSFLLPVDSLAQSGTYPIAVTSTYEKRFSKFSDSNTVNLRVGGLPQFVASVASSAPTDIYAGDSAAITVRIQNAGSSRVESARAKLAASNGIEVKWAGTEQEIGQIAPRGSASSTFNIEADKRLSPGNYNLYLTLNYVGEDKANGTASFVFNIPIKPKADFAASAQTNGTLTAGEDREVSVILNNTGTDDAKNVKVRIRPIYPFSTDGTVRYIDVLPAGQSSKLTYLIHIDKDGTPGEQLSGILIDFEDKQGKKFSDSADFAMVVRSKTTVERLYDYWYIGVFFAFILLIVIVRTIGGRLAARKQ